MLADFKGHGLRWFTFDPFSVWVRSALMLIAFVALPLIGAVAIIDNQAGKLATRQALEQQQTLAVALAADATDYLRLHQAAASGLASLPGVLDLTDDARHSLLREFGASYPDVVAFSIFDVDGRGQGRSDDLHPTDAAGFPLFENARRLNARSLDVRISPLIGRPILAFGAPLRGADGQFVGLLTVALLYAAEEIPVARALAGESVAVDDIEIRRPAGGRFWSRRLAPHRPRAHFWPR